MSDESDLAKLSGGDGNNDEASRNTTTTGSMSSTMNQTSNCLPVPGIVGGPAPLPDTDYRAVHRVRLAALSHNYNCVEAAAARQKCSVIVVVKADGYGHGALSTALHLVDSAKADAFAVATLEEGIALRKALETMPVGVTAKRRKPRDSTSSRPSTPPDSESNGHDPTRPTIAVRSPYVRILVLGPPMGYPRCFDDYYYYNIEVMVSGPEVAKALLEWVADSETRKRVLVERIAEEAKAAALVGTAFPADTLPEKSDDAKDESKVLGGIGDKPQHKVVSSATLSTVSGQDLAKEVRAILLNQQKNPVSLPTSTVSTTPTAKSNSPTPPNATSTGAKAFGGIEAAANSSRNREKAAKASEVFVEDSSDVSSVATSFSKVGGPGGRPRRQLRWHALVDSGMGRLGFKTSKVDATKGGGRDSVAIIKDLVDAEVISSAPLEFYGMCTHMAEASSTSDYTNAQIDKFKSLLKRVRDAGISVPTLSTDNSAALLTTNLTHFNPEELLAQPNSNTRGYVRTGGAIYGQRPAFKQLQAASTLQAAVRHVAILKKGESVGYDRAYVAPMDVRIATLTIGFADGYPRDLGNGVGKVAIRGSIFPIAGNVCMDMLMVELGPADDEDGVGAEVVVGDVAVLWGPVDEHDGEGSIRLQDIAKTLQTTQSELTCGLDKTRVLREYV